jgi:hypothetical protein
VAQFSSISAYRLELTALAADLGAEDANRIAAVMGAKALGIARRSASADLGGDPKMSGWPIAQLDTRIVNASEPGIVLLVPASASAAGGWTVATIGRNRGHGGGFAGPGVNRRTGRTSRKKSGEVRKVRAHGAGSRWNGTTVGKNTATDAQTAMERELPQIAETEFRKVLAKHFDLS